MRRLISWNTAHQLRSVLSGWYRQRTTSRPSSLDDSMFLFHGILDHTITLSQLGECGIDIASYRPWTELSTHHPDAGDTGRGGFTSLCEQLKMEFPSQLKMEFPNPNNTEDSMLSNSHVLNVQRKLSIHPSKLALKASELLKTMGIDVKTCRDILSIAYAVLDFARLLCLSRYLTAITDSSSSSVASSLSSHPLEVAMREHSAAERELQRASSLLLDIPSNSNHHHHHHCYMLNNGVRSRIRICDYLGVHEVLALYQMDRRVSGRLAHLRSLLTEGLSRFLLDLEQYQLSEFFCRFVLQPGMSSTTASSAASSNSVLSHPSSSQPPAAAAADTPLSTARSKYSRITDPSVGIDQLLSFLRAVRIQDIIIASTPPSSSSSVSSATPPSYNPSQHKNLRRFCLLHADWLLTIGLHDTSSPSFSDYSSNDRCQSDYFTVDKSEQELLRASALAKVKGSSSSSTAHAPSQESKATDSNTVVSTMMMMISPLKKSEYSMGRMEEMLLQSTYQSMFDALQQAYSAAQYLCEYLLAVIGLTTRSRVLLSTIYDHDVHVLMRRRQSMLLPLYCGGGKGDDDDGGGGGGQNGRRSESKASRDRSFYCDALLSLGELSCEEDGDGGVGDGSLLSSHWRVDPVAVSAIEGQEGVLAAILEHVAKYPTVARVSGDKDKATAASSSSSSVRSTLVWHCLMQIKPPKRSSTPLVERRCCRSHCHLRCAELLVKHGFPACSPSPECFSCVELLALRRHMLPDDHLLTELLMMMVVKVNEKNGPPLQEQQDASLSRCLHYLLMTQQPRASVDTIRLLLSKIADMQVLATRRFSLSSCLFDEQRLELSLRTHAVTLSTIFSASQVDGSYPSSPAPASRSMEYRFFMMDGYRSFHSSINSLLFRRYKHKHVLYRDMQLTLSSLLSSIDALSDDDDSTAAAEDGAVVRPSTTTTTALADDDDDVSGDIIISYSIIELCILASDEALARIVFAAIEPFYLQTAADSWSSDGSRADEMLHYLHLACAHDVSHAFQWFESLHNASSSSPSLSPSSTSEEYFCSDRTMWKTALEVRHKVPLQHHLSSIYKKKQQQQQLVHPMNMLQLALLCGSGEVIKYLLSIRVDMEIDVSVYMEAVARGRISESIVLMILQRLYPAADTMHSRYSGDDDDEHDDHNADDDDGGGRQRYLDMKSALSTTVLLRDNQGRVLESTTSLLYISCRRGYASVVEHLLRLGASPFSKEDNPYLSMHGDCNDQYGEEVSFLPAQSAIRCSVISGHSRVFRVLVAACGEKVHRSMRLIVYAVRRFLMRKYQQQQQLLTD